VHEIDQQGHGHEGGQHIHVHYFAPVFIRAQPAAKAQVSPKKSTIAPIYNASISSSCLAGFDNASVSLAV
jgi:hypothetical protein